MCKTEQISHKGKRIYYLDFSGLHSFEEIKTGIEGSKKYIGVQPPSSLLTLTNTDGMHFSNEIKDLFTDFAKGNKTYVKASDVIGLSGLASIVYNAIMKMTGRNVKSMKSFEEAKDWLVLQS